MSGLGDAISQATGEESVATVDQPTAAFDALGNGDAPAPALDAPAGDSVLAAVRARAAALAEDTTVDLELPGFGGVLVGRYGAVNLSQFVGVSGGTMHNPFTEAGPAADALATALIGLYGYDAGGELQPLVLPSGHHATSFDDELASALGVVPDAPTARAVLIAVCGGGARGESLAWTHFAQYQAWLTEGAASEVAENAVGEP